ncbi:MAG: hypothetical protein C9356_12420 [Oleiphilus sp.]|nr:MAG: hypothetical protein C9356_12420 [Oleiphilus sp.]
MTDIVITAPEADLEKELANLVNSNIPISVDIPEDIEELKDLLLEQQNHLVRAQAQQGFCFLALKEKLPHGEFETWLKSAGFKMRTVREKMQVARLLLSVPESKRPKLTGLGQKKLVSLAKLDVEIIEELLADSDSENGPDLQALSYQEMRDRIRKLEAEKADLELDKETKQLEHRALLDTLAGRRQLNAKYPDYVNDIRYEANALANEINLRIDEFEQMIDQLNEIAQTGQDNSLSVAITNVDIHCKAIQARATLTVNKLHAQLGDYVEPLSIDYTFNEQELMQSISDREYMTEEHEQQKRIREEERARNRPRKPGRPKKTES